MSNRREAVAQVTPYVRYGLMIFAGYLSNADVVPPGVARTIAADPVLIADAAAGLVALATLVWYGISRSRKALAGLK